MKPMTPEVRNNMLALLDRAEGGLAMLPPFEYDKRADYDAAVGKLVRELEAAGARVNDRPAWDNARMSFGGVKSTCTNGTAGAIRNWCSAAHKRLAGADA